MRSGRFTMPRLPWVTAAVAAVAVAVHWYPGAPEALQLDWAAVRGGEGWRAVTCQLVHWSERHLWWDVATFAVVGSVCEREDRRRMVLCLLSCLAVVPLLVFVAVDGLGFFRGLSGIDCGLFALAATGFATGTEPRLRLAGAAALMALAAKVSFETWSGQTLFVNGGPAVAVPVAHAVGAALGVLSAVVPIRACGPIRARETTSMMSYPPSEPAVLR